MRKCWESKTAYLKALNFFLPCPWPIFESSNNLEPILRGGVQALAPRHMALPHESGIAWVFSRQIEILIFMWIFPLKNHAGQIKYHSGPCIAPRLPQNVHLPYCLWVSCIWLSVWFGSTFSFKRISSKVWGSWAVHLVWAGGVLL